MTHALESDVPIIILAAGEAKRMRGRDKLLELIDDTPLLRLQVQAALAATRGQVFVTLPDEPHPRYDALKELAAVLVPVPDRKLGLSASLRAGLNAVPPDARAAMILLADLPDLTKEDLQKVLKTVDVDSENVIWRGATASGDPGHPAVFQRRLFPALMALGGDSGGAEVAMAHQDKTVLVPLPGSRARCDLDTPEDWANWRGQNEKR